MNDSENKKDGNKSILDNEKETNKDGKELELKKGGNSDNEKPEASKSLIQNEADDEYEIGKEEDTSDLSQRLNEKVLIEFSKKSLLGEFTPEGFYYISEIIATELTSLQKIITNKTTSEYEAYAMCGKLKFQFLVTIEERTNENGEKISITFLKLYETYIKAGEKKNLKTPIARFSEKSNPNFLFTVKKVFNLNTEGETDGRTFSKENEILAPSILSIFRNRFYQYEIKRIESENAELKYIKAIIKILREDKNGKEVVDEFISKTKYGSRQGGKKVSPTDLRKTLDELVEKAVAKKLLHKVTILKIEEVRKKSEFKYDKKGAEKSATAGKGGGKSGGKSAGGGGSKGGGGGSKGGDGGKKDKGKKDKSKKDGLFDIEDFLKIISDKGKVQTQPKAPTKPLQPVKAPVQSVKTPTIQPELTQTQAPTGKFSQKIIFTEYTESYGVDKKTDEIILKQQTKKTTIEIPNTSILPTAQSQRKRQENERTL
ncbi:MAG: hypothetical protein PHC47_00955 [Clostridia bacterium]|jgi:uncharacterized membrane protein YgcG|nr:hypothetical protein [Clostridia bacterium]